MADRFDKFTKHARQPRRRLSTMRLLTRLERIEHLLRRAVRLAMTEFEEVELRAVTRPEFNPRRMIIRLKVLDVATSWNSSLRRAALKLSQDDARFLRSAADEYESRGFASLTTVLLGVEVCLLAYQAFYKGL